MRKKIVCIVLVVLALTYVCAGCKNDSEAESESIKEVEYTKDNFSIMLPEGLIEKDLVQFTAMWQNEEIIVTATKEDFSQMYIINLSADSTINQYMEAVLYNNKVTGQKQNTSVTGEYVYYSMEKNVSGKDYFYFVTAYKGSDAFWLCNFACLLSQKDIYENLFPIWANTVVVK